MFSASGIMIEHDIFSSKLIIHEKLHRRKQSSAP